MKSVTKNIIIYSSLFLSIAALCMSFIRCEPFSIEIISYSIAFLTLIITIYIGIQVYNSFTLRDDIKKINEKHFNAVVKELDRKTERLSIDFDKKIDEKILDFEHSVGASLYQSIAMAHIHDKRWSFFYLMKALERVNLATDKGVQAGIIGYLLQFAENNVFLNDISQSQKNSYISIVADSKDIQASKLIEYISKIKPCEDGQELKEED